MAKFILLTLGCKVNQCESAFFEKALESAGLTPAGPSELADLCIVNTCAVTAKAAMQSRQACRQLIRNHPGAKVLVTGCHAEIAAAEFQTIPGVHRVVGQMDKAQTVALALTLLDGRDCGSSSARTHDPGCFFPIIAQPAGGRTRPFLKIQDGCDAFCTYCIVPHARGRSRSLPPETVLQNLRALKIQGFQEVVLTGIHLGCYGKDLSPVTGLHELLCRIVEAEVMDRVRISSIEPMEVTQPIIDLVAATDRLCPHFHIPLQSGDDGVLKRMHRPYTQSDFAERVLRIKGKMPHAAIGVDILAGFPGETDRAFETTLTLIKELPVTYLHVFPFSPRKGTPAADFPDSVPNGVVKKRCAAFRKLGLKKKDSFYRSQVGRTLRVLVEGGAEAFEDCYHGMSDNYLSVAFQTQQIPKDRMVTVCIERLEKDAGLWGRLLP